MPPVHNIYGDNPYEFEVDLQKYRASDGQPIPATGMLDVELFVAALPGGAPIHNDLVVLMTERSAVPGRYYGIIPTVAINARLKGTYNRKRVQVVVNALSLDLRDEAQVTFLDVRSF